MNHQVRKKQDADRDLWSNCFTKHIYVNSCIYVYVSKCLIQLFERILSLEGYTRLITLASRGEGLGWREKREQKERNK